MSGLLDGSTRPAAVGPYAATWLLRRLSEAGVGSAQVREQAAFVRAQGRGDLAWELEWCWRQLRSAAEDHRRQAAPPAHAVVSDDGSAAAVKSEGGASSVTTEEVTTTEAAEMLQRSSRRVTQLLAAGALRGRQVGRSWLIERSSVEDLMQVRRTA